MSTQQTHDVISTLLLRQNGVLTFTNGVTRWPADTPTQRFYVITSPWLSRASVCCSSTPGVLPSVLSLCYLMRSRADSRFALSQWETVLLCNGDSHSLGESPESALRSIYPFFSRLNPEGYKPRESMNPVHISCEELYIKFLYCMCGAQPAYMYSWLLV